MRWISLDLDEMLCLDLFIPFGFWDVERNLGLWDGAEWIEMLRKYLLSKCNNKCSLNCSLYSHVFYHMTHHEVWVLPGRCPCCVVWFWLGLLMACINLAKEQSLFSPIKLNLIVSYKYKHSLIKSHIIKHRLHFKYTFYKVRTKEIHVSRCRQVPH